MSATDEPKGASGAGLKPSEPANTKPTVETEKGRILASVLQENERLKRGDFTPAEFQNLCHKKTVQDGFESFVTGCHEYQKQLFGVSADEVADEVERLKDEVVEAAVEDHTADENWPEASEKLSRAVKALLDYRDIKQTPKRMNYRALLLKYITFVGDEEGTNFITSRRGDFTDAEWSELEALSKESLQENGG